MGILKTCQSVSDLRREVSATLSLHCQPGYQGEQSFSALPACSLSLNRCIQSERGWAVSHSLFCFCRWFSTLFFSHHSSAHLLSLCCLTSVNVSLPLYVFLSASSHPLSHSFLSLISLSLVLSLPHRLSSSPLYHSASMCNLSSPPPFPSPAPPLLIAAPQGGSGSCFGLA